MKVRAKLTLRNEVVIAARERLNLTQAKAAKAAGISLEKLGRIERMQFVGVSEQDVHALAKFIEVDADLIAPPELREQRAIRKLQHPSRAKKLMAGMAPPWAEDK